MSPHDKRRVREIETPLGPVEIGETKWNEDREKPECWQFIQCLEPNFADCQQSGDILAYFLMEYSIAYRMINDGYVMEEQLDDNALLWTKYED